MHNYTEFVRASARLFVAALGYLILKKLQEGHFQLTTGTQLGTHAVCSQC